MLANERQEEILRQLAKSGTVTLELGVSGVPMVTAYKMASWEVAIARRLIRVPSVILTNLVLGENVVPEFIQNDCTPDRLAAALTPLLSDSEERRRQIEAFARLDQVMEIGVAQPARRAVSWSWIAGLGFSMPSLTWLISRSASRSVIGCGLVLSPRKAVTFGVFLTRCQLSSVISIVVRSQ